MVYFRHSVEAIFRCPARSYLQDRTAVSRDGVNWIKEEARQIIGDRLGVDESQALPTVTEIASGKSITCSSVIGSRSISGEIGKEDIELDTRTRTTW